MKAAGPGKVKSSIKCAEIKDPRSHAQVRILKAL